MRRTTVLLQQEGELAFFELYNNNDNIFRLDGKLQFCARRVCQPIGRRNRRNDNTPVLEKRYLFIIIIIVIITLFVL